MRQRSSQLESGQQLQRRQLNRGGKRGSAQQLVVAESAWQSNNVSLSHHATLSLRHSKLQFHYKQCRRLICQRHNDTARQSEAAATKKSSVDFLYLNTGEKLQIGVDRSITAAGGCWCYLVCLVYVQTSWSANNISRECVCHQSVPADRIIPD